MSVAGASTVAGDGSSSRSRLSEIQRGRLLAAAVSAVDQYGYADATVAHITAHARVSRRTFYDLFENREDCLAALMGDTFVRVQREIAAAGLDGLSWRERVRGGLWTILRFFDREPALARAVIVQGARGSQSVLEQRAAILAGLARVIDEGRNESSNAAAAPALTAEGLVGAAHAIVYERVLRRDPEPLASLFSSLMSMIVLPYLGASASRREAARPAPATIEGPTEEHDGSSRQTERDPLRDLPMRLTFRTIQVLHVIARNPGISNKKVGDSAGVSDQGQISKLLTRLERLGLVENTGEGHAKGEANAWRITATGQRVTQNIELHTNHTAEAA